MSLADALRLHRARRPSQRRQVDARQRDRRRQGRDRVRQAADDSPRDPRRRQRPGLAARARRPAGRAAPARRAHRADAAPGRARARGRRRLPVRAQRRAGGRPRRPVHRRAAAGGSGAGRDRGQQGRPHEPRADARPRCRPPPSSTSPRRSSRCRPRTGAGVGPLVDHLVSLLPEGPFYFEPEQRSDQSETVMLAELVREQVLARTREEVPHAVEVEVEGIEDARPDPDRGGDPRRDRVPEGDPDRRRRPDGEGDRGRRATRDRARARRPTCTSS